MSSTLPPSAAQAIHPGTRIGHVHLKVADLDRALRFYCDVLGFQLMQRYGAQAAFISAGGYHHHIGLNTWESRGGSPPAPGSTGLYHTAILYPTRPALADALRRLIAAGVPLDGASDHGVSEALYLRDPDQNGVELYQLSLGGDVDFGKTAIGTILGPAVTADKVVEAVDSLVATYLDNRQDNERFVDTYRRLGAKPFKERVYAAV